MSESTRRMQPRFGRLDRQDVRLSGNWPRSGELRAPLSKLSGMVQMILTVDRQLAVKISGAGNRRPLRLRERPKFIGG